METFYLIHQPDRPVTIRLDDVEHVDEQNKRVVNTPVLCRMEIPNQCYRP